MPRSSSEGRATVMPGLLIRSLALGVASGARSMSALTTLVWSAGGPRQPERLLGSRPVRVLAVAGALIEAVGDKLPLAPPRTEPVSLTARVAAAAVSAWLLARREGVGSVGPVLVATLAAAAASAAGPQWRALAKRTVGRDLPGALAEDVAAFGIARWAVSPSEGITVRGVRARGGESRGG